MATFMEKDHKERSVDRQDVRGRARSINYGNGLFLDRIISKLTG